MWDIQDFDELYIYISNGFKEIYVPKFRMEAEIENTTFVRINYCYNELGGNIRTEIFDYTEVVFGYVAPSSASELLTVLLGYKYSAFSGGNPGTVTSVGITGNDGISVSGSPVTSGGNITLDLGAITPNSVAAVGTVTGSNLSGTNTGDQTLNGLLPTQTGNSGKVLSTDGTNSSWVNPYYFTDIIESQGQALFANTTHFYGPLPVTVSNSAASMAPKIARFACVIYAIEGVWQTTGTQGTAETLTMHIRVNNTTNYLVGTVASNTRFKEFFNTSLNGGSGITLAVNDYYHIIIVSTALATPPTGVYQKYFLRLRPA